MDQNHLNRLFIFTFIGYCVIVITLYLLPYLSLGDNAIISGS